MHEHEKFELLLEDKNKKDPKKSALLYDFKFLNSGTLNSSKRDTHRLLDGVNQQSCHFFHSFFSTPSKFQIRFISTENLN